MPVILSIVTDIILLSDVTLSFWTVLGRIIVATMSTLLGFLRSLLFIARLYILLFLMALQEVVSELGIFGDSPPNFKLLILINTDSFIRVLLNDWDNRLQSTIIINSGKPCSASLARLISFLVEINNGVQIFL